MVFCPECNMELEGDPSHCYLCGHSLKDDQGMNEWIVIGTVENKIMADFVKETLKSEKIPAVVLSRSGYFGDAGLPLNPIYTTGDASFEISVPESYSSDATDLLDMTLGEKWHKKEGQ